MATILSDSSHSTTRSLRGLISIPNMLSLDAPLVAIGWQWLLRSGFDNPSPPNIPASSQPMLTMSSGVLFITVWLIYMADRLLDCRRMDFSREATLRHRFAKRWSSILWPLWGVMLATGGLTAFTYLHRELLIGGCILLGFVTLYAAAVHRVQPRQQRLPKEFIVGSLFAFGVSLPVVTARVTFSLGITTGLLAALFVLNCLCVATAQRPSDRQQGMDSAVLMYPPLSTHLPWLAAGLATISASLGISGSIPLSITAAVSLSCILLIPIAWSIDDQTSKLSASPLSTSTRGELADYALLSPFLIMAIAT
ncbi:putative membrane protein [Rhodopirellula maiorica SM1]|uniref:Putative membrane protein n=1 Tax=Rhodopirellula maiorica SM1 TaxID=1265738 RepID=M5RG32_9BACT|nr:hypothetical protein [Rhodopirellula maiorica]EMI18285.1 putative membrane protein [Rhodopirellula maiorica SM1]